MSRLVRRLAAGQHRKRYERVAAGLGLRPEDRILDLGCGLGPRSVAGYNTTNEVTGLDRRPSSTITFRRPNFRYVQGDAGDLSIFADRSFDVVMSFGMLEHIPDDRLVSTIREAQRVGRRYCFVVPHRYAFVEPHYLLPLFALWPDGLKSALVRRFALGSQRRSESGEWQRIHWFTRAEWRRLFSDPNLRIVDHWYGPVLLDYLIFGGEPGDRSPGS